MAARVECWDSGAGAGQSGFRQPVRSRARFDLQRVYKLYCNAARRYLLIKAPCVVCFPHARISAAGHNVQEQILIHKQAERVIMVDYALIHVLHPDTEWYCMLRMKSPRFALSVIRNVTF